MPTLSRRDALKFLSGLAALGAGAAGLAPISLAQSKIRPDEKSVLIVVDVQNCFVPGGSLAVQKGDEIVPLINKLAAAFQNVVITQDWHHPKHISFASQHAGKKPFETIDVAYGTQVLWPDHCVQGTEGAALHKDLRLPNAQVVIRKGFRQNVDSYSAFMEADRKTPTGLTGYLKARGIEACYIVGLATDFCVSWTATDARAAGFQAGVIEDACRGIDLNGSMAKAWAVMQTAGVKRMQSRDFAI